MHYTVNIKMKFKNLLLAAALLAAPCAVAQQISPLTKAMLRGYEEILKQNPKDYGTLYERATQYYNLSMYDDALVDIAKALDCTPEKEKDLRIDEYSLLADIYIQIKEYDKAMNAVDSALELVPRDYALMYKKGNIALYLNRPEDAYNAFSVMQRLKSRSQEAFFGMARADIMMGKKEDARKLITEAQNADPSNFLTYCRIGELYEDMGEDENAATSYLSGFSLADGKSSRPLESLIHLADKNYDAVDSALQYAISRTSNTDALYFLQASIAYNSGNFNKAYDAFKKLLESKDGQIGSVYATMALCCMDLNKMNDASTYADLAIIKDNTPENQVVKATVELAAGNAPAALIACKKALQVNTTSTSALTLSGLANIVLDDPQAALQALNEAVMTDPTDIYARMIRAYIYLDKLKDSKEAVMEYSRIAGTTEPENIMEASYKALAQCLGGKKLDADATMEKALREKTDKTKDDYYYAAVYYAQTGNLEKGKSMIDNAISLGYQNLYNLYTNTTANLNIAPIRHLLSK